MEKLTQLGQFPFTCRSILDTNLNLSHLFDKFIFCKIVTIQFKVHSLNFWIAKKSNAKFKHFFRLMSIYLVQLTEKPEISIPSKRKRSSDKQIILPSRTKNTLKFINLLKWPTNSCLSQSTPHASNFEKKKVLGKRQMIGETEKKHANKIIIDFIC